MEKNLQNSFQLFYTDPYIQVNETIIAQFGLTEACWLAKIMNLWRYHYDRGDLDDEGYCYIIQDRIQEKLGLNGKQQRSARKKFIDAEIIETKRGDRGRIHYKINFYKLVENIDKIRENRQSNGTNNSGRKIDDHISVKLTDVEPLSERPYIYSNNRENNNREVIPKDINFVNTFGSVSSKRPKKKSNNSNNRLLLGRAYSEDAKTIFAYWNEASETIVHKLDDNGLPLNKTAKQGYLEIDKCLNSYSRDEIIDSITVYNSLLANEGTYFGYTNGSGKKTLRVSLSDFLNSRSLYQRWKNSGAKIKIPITMKKSLFEEMLREEPEIAFRRPHKIQNRDNGTAIKIRTHYCKSLGYDPKTKTFDAFTENCFIKAANKISDFYRVHELKLNIPKSKIIDILFDYYREKKKVIDPRWLTNDSTYNSMLMNHLFDNDLISEQTIVKRRKAF